MPGAWRRWAWALLVLGVAVVGLRELTRWRSELPASKRMPAGSEPVLVQGQLAPGAASEKRPKPATIDLPDELWQGVRDDTVFRSDEHSAFYQLLSQLANVSPAELQAASQGVIGFLPLSQQISEYRGQIVTIEGTARRSVVVKAEPNDFGIKKFFQVWIRPADTSAGPLVVYCLELPPGFPMGHEIEAAVELDAVVFKRWAYRATDGTRTAPLLLARDLRWDKNRTLATKTQSPNWLLVIGAAAAISASAVFWIWFTSPRRRKPLSNPLSTS